jgi:uncharacterized repeat protein (TIGR01451 family)
VFKDSGTGGGTANNGIQNSNELGIAGVSVKLTNCAASTYATAITDGAGNYSLSLAGVSAGAVCVEQTNLSGYISIGANTIGASPAITYTISTADKISFTLASSTSYSSLNFADVPVNQFLTDGSQAGIAGATLTYPHTFIASTGGTVAFSLPTATASPVIAGWGEVLYTDANCNGVLDGSEGTTALLPTDTTTVTEGQTICLIQKEFISANAAQGSSNLVPVRATFVYTNATSVTATVPVAIANAILNRQDLTTVSSNALVLRKEVRNVDKDLLVSPTTKDWKTSNTAKSGETLEYRLTYTNNGAEVINGTTLNINDATPAFTTFVSGLCETATAATPTSLGTCSLTKTLNASFVGTLKWSFTGATSKLSSGASGFVTYKVKVD